MSFTRIFPFVFALLTPWASSAQETRQTSDLGSVLTSGLAAFQKQDLDEARKSFAQAHEQAPNNPIPLYNLGMVEFKAKQIGRAVAKWRQALQVDPTYTPAQHALAWVSKDIAKGLPSERETNLWENIRRDLLLSLPLERLLWLTGFCAAVFIWLLLRYLGQMRRYQNGDMQNSPGFSWPLALGTILLLVSGAIAVAKFAADLSPRATIVASEKSAIRTSPETTATVLFELPSGAEVIVREKTNDWYQISLPGGMSGWVAATEIE